MPSDETTQSRGDTEWSQERVSELFGVTSRQATAITDAWENEEELVSDFESGQTMTDYNGVGDKTWMGIKSYLEHHHQESFAERRKNREGIATEFGTDGERTDDGDLIWWFVCPRCGFEQGCHGDPSGFANRPYSCGNCRWVSLLHRDEMSEILPDTRGEKDA